MEATYVTRDKADFADVIETKSKEDVLKRADILAQQTNPSSLFGAKETVEPFGILVLFDSRLTREQHMREVPSIGSVAELKSLIEKLSDYEPFTERDYESARQEYLSAKEGYQKAIVELKQCAKEMHSLQTSWKNTQTQRDWLQRENHSRSIRLSKCQREIEEYELVLKNEIEKDEKRKKEIQNHNRSILKLQAEEKKKKEEIEEIETEISALRAQITFSSRMLHPQATKEKEEMLNKLYQKQKEYKELLDQQRKELKEAEESVWKLKEISNVFNEKKERIETSLETSRSGLDKAQRDLDRGNKMIDESNSRLEMMRLRLVDLGEKEIRAIEEKEKTFKDMFQKADRFLKTWMGCSEVFQKCIQMEEVDATTLINVLFFACGTLCASGATACQYFSNTTVQLDYLMLYGNKEERPGFWNIIEFE